MNIWQRSRSLDAIYYEDIVRSKNLIEKREMAKEYYGSRLDKRNNGRGFYYFEILRDTLLIHYSFTTLFNTNDSVILAPRCAVLARRIVSSGLLERDSLQNGRPNSINTENRNGSLHTRSDSEKREMLFELSTISEPMTILNDEFKRIGKHIYRRALPFRSATILTIDPKYQVSIDHTV